MTLETSSPRVAIYLRQSKDQDGDALAIDRQRDNCVRLAEFRGWTVEPTAFYIDNNVSASTNRVRPAYQRLVADVRERKVDVVIAWNLDRLTRKPREIEDWIELHEHHGVNLLTSEARDPIDLSTDNGRMLLRITAAVARSEVERKARRQRESNNQARESGIPPTGRRAFGYTVLKPGAKACTAVRVGEDGREYPDYGHEPIESEAAAIRRGFALLLAGESLRSIAREWNAAGLSSTSGAAWRQDSVRGVLTNPRYAGLVAPPRSTDSGGNSASRYDLAQMHPGTWEPLVSIETWGAASAILRDPARRKVGGAPVRWLLSGLATCGLCGAPVKAGATRDAVKVYRCSATPHLSRRADYADEYVAHATIRYLSETDAAELLAADEAEDTAALRAELSALQARVGDMAGLVADGTLTADQARESMARLRGQIGDLQARLTDAGRTDVLGPLVAAEDVREAWAGLSVDMRRAVVAALWAVSMVSPGKGSRPPRDEEGRLGHTERSVLLTPR